MLSAQILHAGLLLHAIAQESLSERTGCDTVPRNQPCQPATLQQQDANNLRVSFSLFRFARSLQESPQT